MFFEFKLMHSKTNKIVLYSVALVLLHILFSLGYLVIAKVFSFYPTLSNIDIFMKWFKEYWVVLLFPFLYFVIREIRKKSN